MRPVPGSTLPGPTVAFTWDPQGTVVETYALWFGSSLGAFDLGGSGVLPGSQTSYTKTDLPTDSRTVFVRFWFKVAGVWQQREYSYTASTIFSVTYSISESETFSKNPSAKFMRGNNIR